MKKIAALVMTMVLIAPVYAQGAPAILPDSPFYGIKKAFEKVSLALTFDKEAKAEKLIELSNERMAEARLMAERNKSVNVLVSESQRNINRASSIADDNNSTEMEEDILEAREAHIETLNSIHDKVPEEAKFGIETAMANAISESEKEVDDIERINPEKRDELEESLNRIRDNISEKTKSQNRLDIGSIGRSNDNNPTRTDDFSPGIDDKGFSPDDARNNVRDNPLDSGNSVVGDIGKGLP